MLDEVESTIYQVAQQILRGEGFSYGIPSRSKGNQVYVPELDRIVLKDSKSQRPFASTSTCRKAVITTRILQLIHELCLKRIHVTKRDLFYTDVKLFEVCIFELCLAVSFCPGRHPPCKTCHTLHAYKTLCNVCKPFKRDCLGNSVDQHNPGRCLFRTT